MKRALVGGVLVGVLASYFGVFVVQRRLSFLGAGLSHAAFGGVALGLLLGTEPLAVAVPFTVLVSLGLLGLVPGVLGIFEKQEILGFSAWALALLGGLFFLSGVGIIQSIRSRPEA